MIMRSRTVMLRWSVMMLGLVLVGLMLTTSGGQARSRSGSELRDSRDGSGFRDDKIERDSAERDDVERDGRDPGDSRDGSNVGRGDGGDGGDRFNAIVRRLQAHGGIEETSPPFMWLASLAVRGVRPAGVLDFRLATFEGRHLGDVARDRDFDTMVRQTAGEGWTPLLQVRSSRKGELVSIQTRTYRDHVSLLLVTIDSHDAVVIQLAVSPDAIAQWIKEPVRIRSRARMTE
jgi:hypothetical protein